MAPLTLRQCLKQLTRRLARSGVYFGHGTDNAGDEAAALLWHVCGLAPQVSARTLNRRLRAAERQGLELLLRRRVQERVPLAYLMGYTWFAGLKFQVDPTVLIPRSPIAELIEQRFAPWIEAQRVRRIVDIGTGSGCIAIACARAFPKAQVDAVDIDPAALGAAMAARPHVAEVHDLHIWEITTGMPAASAHVLVEPHYDCHAVRADLEALLAREHGITHLTLQVDHCPDTDDRPAAPADPQVHPATPDHGHPAVPLPPAVDASAHEDHAGDAHADGIAMDRLAAEPHIPADDPGDNHTGDNHAPGPPHCEDSHGPAYRPTRQRP